MTTWYWHEKRTTVENCIILDVNWLQRVDAVKTGKDTTGELVLNDNFHAEYSVIMGTFEGAFDDYHGLLRLQNNRIGFSEIALTRTPANLGGYRYWFLCPYCSRRVVRLYLPPDARDFKCRTCHDLTYTSCQESHKDDALYKHIGGHLGISGKMVEQLLRKG